MTKQTSVVTIDRNAFDESTLKIAQAIAVMDLLYVIACNNAVEQVSENSLVNAMYTANQLLDDAYDSLRNMGEEGKP